MQTKSLLNCLRVVSLKARISVWRVARWEAFSRPNSLLLSSDFPCDIFDNLKTSSCFRPSLQLIGGSYALSASRKACASSFSVIVEEMMKFADIYVYGRAAAGVARKKIDINAASHGQETR